MGVFAGDGLEPPNRTKIQSGTVKFVLYSVVTEVGVRQKKPGWNFFQPG